MFRAGHRSPSLVVVAAGGGSTDGSHCLDGSRISVVAPVAHVALVLHSYWWLLDKMNLWWWEGTKKDGSL